MNFAFVFNPCSLRLFFPGINDSNSLPGRHIYYEPPDEFDWSADTALISSAQTTGAEVVVHRKENGHTDGCPSSNHADEHEKTAANDVRAYTEEEFTSAILARTKPGNRANRERKTSPSELPGLGGDTPARLSAVRSSSDLQLCSAKSRDALMCENGNSVDSSSCSVNQDAAKDRDLIRKNEKRSSGVKLHPDSRRSDHSVSPLPERRNKSVLGRLKSFASRTSYSTSEDGHSHSSDYEEPEEEKKADPNFQRDAKERSSASWVRHLRRDVKKRISRLKSSRISANSDEGHEAVENPDGHVQTGSSMESIPSGSGSSLQPPTPTSSNRSSTSAGEEENAPYVGAFLGRARALVDYTPSPYDKDGLAFKKGDIIDIIAKHKTGIWVGMVQGKVGHFKFINVEEIPDESKSRHKRHRVPGHWLSTSRKPETLEELLKQLGLQEYMNVLVLNGYDELDTFKEIEKEDLDTLGIINPEHGLKLLRAAEMLQGMECDVDESAEDQFKHSPRDSGCYASHENLSNRDAGQSNLQSGVQIEEEAETSQSESGIHSRDGRDLSLAMNNLDLSAESSTRSMATTLDSREDVAAASSAPESSQELSGFNILPGKSQQEGPCTEISPHETDSQTSTDFGVSASTESQPFVPVTTFANSISSSASTENCVFLKCNSVPSITEASGPQASVTNASSQKPAGQKNSRSKHKTARSKHDGSRHSRTIPRGSEHELYADRNSYIHGWSSFAKKDKRSRRTQEYDDVVSDPALEPEKSPIRHVYRRTKHRKGSLQELVHNPKPPSASLLTLVKQKLEKETIFLFEEPYTDKTGFCGIPPALVQRYAEELQHNLPDVANALDQIRITSLQQQARRGVPNDFLADSCIVPVIEANYSCLHSWLISLGLPMYESSFVSHGCRNLEQVSRLNFDELSALGVQDARHRVFLEAAIQTLRTRFGLRTTCSTPDRLESTPPPFSVL